MGRFFDTLLSRPVYQDHERAFVDRLEHWSARADTELAGAGTADNTWIEQLEAEFARIAAPSEALLARLAQTLEQADDDTRLGFWQRAGERLPDSGYVAACLGDALMSAGREAEALDALLCAVERVPELFEVFSELEDLARHAGDRVWLRYQLAGLRAHLDRDVRAYRGDDSDDSDDSDSSDDDRRDDSDSSDDDSDNSDNSDDDRGDIRERYSELLEQYDDDADAVAAIRALGRRIAELEDSGVLPRVLMRRGQWRQRE